METNLSTFQEMVKDRGATVHMADESWTRLSD